MPHVKHGKLFMVMVLLTSSAAYAQQSIGNTSGPAIGTIVDPSAVVQKQYQEELQQGRSVESGTRPAPVTPGATGGMPGVEALPGTEGGRVPADAPEGTDQRAIR